MQNKTLSYQNDSNLKKLVIQEMKRHQKQDKFIKGSYGYYEGDNFKGCAIGCTINSINKILGQSYGTNSYDALYKTLGIPSWLSKVQDSFFECLPNEYSDKFAIDFLESIPIGVDLEPVRWKLCINLLKQGIKIIQDKENLMPDIKDEAIEALRNSLSLYESADKTNIWISDISNDYIKKIQRLVLKANIHFNCNASHIVNMVFKSIKLDLDSMHSMFYSATAGFYDGKLSSETIENAYIDHSNQLLNLLKNAA